MQIGMVGLGRMGEGLTHRLIQGGHSCVGFDVDPAAVARIVKAGAAGAKDAGDLVRQLTAPRVIWVMLPAGQITDDAVVALGEIVSAGDTIIDGGNSFYRDDIRRAKALKRKDVNYVDIGTSGGVWGFERGFCMMIGGDRHVVESLDPILETLAPGLGSIPRTKRDTSADPRAERGYIHAGPAGAGHFVKMVHNGIEYGLMQAYAEGFDILRNKNSRDLDEDERFELNIPDIAEVWRRGSVISSWLLDLSAAALAHDPELKQFTGFVQDSGEGRWTVEAAIEEAVSAEVLTTALYARFRSRRDHTFGDKMLSAMRFGFGGHIEGSETVDPKPVQEKGQANVRGVPG